MPPCLFSLLHLDLGDLFLQCRGSLEAHGFRGLDLDGLIDRRIAALACGALGHGEGAESREREAVFLFQAAADEAEQLLDDFLRLNLG